MSFGPAGCWRPLIIRLQHAGHDALLLTTRHGSAIVALAPGAEHSLGHKISIK